MTRVGSQCDPNEISQSSRELIILWCMRFNETRVCLKITNTAGITTQLCLSTSSTKVYSIYGMLQTNSIQEAWRLRPRSVDYLIWSNRKQKDGGETKNTSGARLSAVFLLLRKSCLLYPAFLEFFKSSSKGLITCLDTHSEHSCHLTVQVQKLHSPGLCKRNV